MLLIARESPLGNISRLGIPECTIGEVRACESTTPLDGGLLKSRRQCVWVPDLFFRDTP